MIGSLWLWLGFIGFVVAMLAVDLGVFHRKAHAITIKEAVLWSVAWIALAMLFNVALYLISGPEPGIQFLAGYLIEKSLSVDNIFVFALLFSALSVPQIYQHRVLFWGILGALLMRGLLIALGATLLEQFHRIIYLFGLFLIITSIRMALHRKSEVRIERNIVLRLLRRVMPITDGYVQEHFFVRRMGQLFLTPLFLALVVVETTDLIFAVDSIPAIFAVTENPFIVYTSNVFALLGLRSLYFVFAELINKFVYLKYALSIILGYVGIKMLLTDLYHIPTPLSLAFIAFVLALAIVASVVHTRSRAWQPGEQRNRDADADIAHEKQAARSR